MLFLHPEAAAALPVRRMLEAVRQRLWGAPFIDEGHYVSSWNTGFRTAFGELHSFIDFICKGGLRRAHVLDATLPQAAQCHVRETLRLARPPTVFQPDPARRHLTYELLNGRLKKSGIGARCIKAL